MDLTFSMALPRQTYTMAVMRQFIGAALRVNGIGAEDRHDILIAASEACANVVQHGGPDPQYQVLLRIRGDSCRLEIHNTGPVFQVTEVPVSLDAESGRGLGLMRSLMDEVSVSSVPEGGTLVSLDKYLKPAPPVYSRSPSLPVPYPRGSRPDGVGGRAPSAALGPAGGGS